MANRTLVELQAEFRAGSTNAMPIAGMFVWAGIGIAALFVSERVTANLALYVMVVILPLAFIIEWTRGRNLFAGGDEPLTKLFLLNVLIVGLLVPMLVIAVRNGGEPLLMVLGMAVLAGVIWIPYGWAADDRSGIIHGVGRAIGCYIAYGAVDPPYKATAICAVVVVSYLYSLASMRRNGPTAQAEATPT